ncbi:MAG: MvdC/MvdD family ATP grasp protein, partial [Myxococcaceae bacterium]
MSTEPCRVLIVSHPEDAHAAHVEKIIHRLYGERCLNLDYHDFPAAIELGCRLSNVERQPLLRRHFAGTSTRLSDFRSVWLRRPSPPNPHPTLEPGFQKYVRGECNSFLEALPGMMPQATWVSSPSSTRHANLKPIQLQAALSVGFEIPETFIGTSPAEVEVFLSRHEFATLKPLHRPNVELPETLLQRLQRRALRWMGLELQVLESTEGSNKQIYFAERLSRDQLLSRKNDFTYCPVILQEYIDKRLELRVVVVDQRVFACAMHTQESSSVDQRMDMRIANLDDIRHERFELPVEIKAR